MQRSSEDIQDELLVLRCQGGEPEAFRLLVSRWQTRLQRLAMRMTGDRDAATDLVQEVWLAIVRGLRGLEDPARFRVWVYGITTNKCADWVRRRVVRRDAIPDLRRAAVVGTEAKGPGELEEADQIIRLRGALRRLPQELRMIVSLHYLDGFSVCEIATVFDVPAGTVKSRLHKARAQLRKALEERQHERTGQENS